MLTGSCFCRAVSFAIEGEVPNPSQCQCSLCRKVTVSSANADTIVAASKFRWIAGDESIRSFRRESGYRNDFCAHRGSSVPNATRSGTIWIRMGLIDGETGLGVARHVLLDSRADRETSPFNDAGAATAATNWPRTSRRSTEKTGA